MAEFLLEVADTVVFLGSWLGGLEGIGREEEGGGAYKRAGLSGGGGGVVSWVACLFVVVRGYDGGRTDAGYAR